MIPTSWLLFADDLTSPGYDWKNAQSNADWILPVLIFLALAAFVVYMYRRDAAELPLPVAVCLTFLRTATLLALLFLYMHPQKQEEKTTNSRVVVLVDTSRSMGRVDPEVGWPNSGLSRIQQVAAALKQSPLLEQLRRTHDVIVVPFDDDLHRDRVISLPKLGAEQAEEDAEKPEDAAAADDEEAAGADAHEKSKVHPIDWDKVLELSGQETQLCQALRQVINDHATARLSGVLVFSDGGQNAGVGQEAAIDAAYQARVPIVTVGVGSEKVPPNVRVAAFNPPPRAYPGDPCIVTGVIQAWRMAKQTVTVQLLSRKAGGGAAERGTGDVLDTQEVTLGGDGEEVPVKFVLRPDEVGRRTLCLKVIPPANDRDPSGKTLEADMEIVESKNRVLLLAGGPTREYQFLRNQLFRDKSILSDVLLQTGRPGMSQDAHELLDTFPKTREEMYKYDCVVAFDPNWQAISADLSDADAPIDPAELAARIDLLETWVAEQGGGLIVVAGPVYTGQPIKGWTQDKAMAKIQALYPVQFQHRFAATDTVMEKTEESWPLSFTPEGLDAEFVSLSDSAATSRQTWKNFKVFSYFPVRGPKKGATVLARFSDPRAAIGNEQPVYMAWQFYGSGQVFYLGSGEMWRLRGLGSDTYFEQFYTKVIRHVSKGRLLRGSNRGMLLVGEERYLLGNTVTVRAHRLTNAQLEPLQVPSVKLQVITEKGVQNVTLRQEAARPGSYVGQFPVLHAGQHRLELPLPDGGDEPLTQQFTVEIPNKEREHPQRNDKLLGELAKKTFVWEDTAVTEKAADEEQPKPAAEEGGKPAAEDLERPASEYYVGIDELLKPPEGKRPLEELLKDRSKASITGYSREWEQQWLRLMMYGLFGLLCAEWLVRRLLKLA